MFKERVMSIPKGVRGDEKEFKKDLKEVASEIGGESDVHRI